MIVGFAVAVAGGLSLMMFGLGVMAAKRVTRIGRQ